MNTICTFPAYLQDHQLSRYGDAEGGWIFSLYLFMTYGNGLRVGPAFDAVWSAFLSEYLQFSMALVHFLSLVSITTIEHWFNVRHGLAKGIASCAGSLGGVLSP